MEFQDQQKNFIPNEKHQTQKSHFQDSNQNSDDQNFQNFSNHQQQFPQENIEFQDLNQQQNTSQSTKAKTIKFSLISNFFNKLTVLRGRRKSDFVKSWVKKLFQKNRMPQFSYSILRLLLPSDDKDRGNYGVKQRVLAKIVKVALNLNKDQHDRLTHYKNPNFHQNGVGIGDFALCMYNEVAKLCNSKSQLTVARLNKELDDLANASQIDDQINVFRHLFEISNAQQIKWITRIILKDLKLSLKIQNVLNSFHKEAYEYFNLTTSLKEVCKKFEDPNVKLSNQVSLFHPIRPMLAGKKKMDYFSQYQNKKYYAQVKYDGERIQAHISKDQVKIYSRNAVDYSHTYGTLIPYLQKNVEADSCILDGELVVVNKKTFQIQPFGQNKCVAQQKDGDKQLCYKVFDLLWLKVQGEEVNLMGYPLQQRKQLLQKTLTPQPGILEVVSYKMLDNYEDILKEFNQCIQRRQEGLMLKDPDSIYSPKQRGQSWLKLKGQYVDGLTDNLDLIIMGGYFGTSSYRVGSGTHWTERITCFLLGLIVDLDPQNEKIAYAMPFCKVGTGYDQQKLATLRSKLRNNLVQNDGKTIPQFMNHPKCRWKPKLQDRPDCFVNYLCNSFILEVKAAQIIQSATFSAGYTLRFPRCVKIRYNDKSWDQAMKFSELEEMVNNSQMRNIKRKRQGSDSQNQGNKQKDQDNVSKRRKMDFHKKPKDELMSENICVQLKNQPKKSHIFHGMEFNIMSIDNSGNKGFGYTKHQIARQILLNNGTVVQNVILTTTDYIICQKQDFRTRLLIENNKGKVFKFVKPNWIFNCSKLGELIQLSPIYVAITPFQQRQYYRENYDQFGDSYYDKLQKQQLDEILKIMSTFDNLKKYKNYQGVQVNKQLMDRIRPKKRRVNKVSYCINVQDLFILKLKGHGNRFVKSLNDSPNSIIIINEEDQKFLKARDQIDWYIKSRKNGQYIQIEYLDDIKKELEIM